MTRLKDPLLIGHVQPSLRSIKILHRIVEWFCTSDVFLDVLDEDQNHPFRSLRSNEKELCDLMISLPEDIHLRKVLF